MKIHPKGTLLLRQHVGEATDPNTNRTYKMSLVNGFIPCIESDTSKRSAIFEWDELLQQAIASGIDRQPRVAKPK